MTQRISRAAAYGLAAAAHVAKKSKDGPVMSKVIADKYDFPLAFLLKIMQQMVMANILRSKRGPRGGFTLARPAKDISMLDIIEAVDGPFIQMMEMVELTNKAPFAKRIEQVGNDAIDKARDKFQKAKLSRLIG
jgi:Rrf2 family protein